ncbi:hypothetical protein CAEBREN_07349 [Caenorhabditis brenneri]|uniref:Uncharacterized protein n=1 Tax=Caenorhabditis brenneri TaxID=135651 RepID=G0N1Y8_CAEBE|nr:hypothetical protein CAEBREN_07349 [Caenorhabditis brenneri]
MSSIEQQPETLFTQDEVNAIEGKMKCFYKLRTNPETKKVFDATAQSVRSYEDVIIRVIVGGETVEVAMKHQKERQIESTV